MTRCIRLIVTLALLICGTAQAAELVVGQLIPASSILASSAEQLRVGAKVYFDHINDQGGVNGLRIKHVILDDGYKVPETIRLTRELIEVHKAVVLLGITGTANVGELIKQDILSRNDIALVGPITGGTALRTPFNRNVFHIRASYGDEAEQIVNHLKTVRISKVAVLYQNDGLGKDGLEGVRKALEKRGHKVHAAASFERGTDNVEEAVEILHKAKPEAIVMISITKPTAAFVKKYHAAGGTAQLFSVSVSNAAEIVQLAGLESSRGLGVAQVMPSPYSGHTPLARQYAALMKQYAPDSPLTYFGLESFVGAKVVTEALKRAGPNPRPGQVLQAMESLSHFDVGGIVYKFSKTNRVGSKYVDITVVAADGRLLR